MSVDPSISRRGQVIEFFRGPRPVASINNLHATVVAAGAQK
jgi:hypothetical protein